MRVLIVDDAQETLEVLALQYEMQAGIQTVCVAPDRQSALSLLAESEVDLVSIDIQLGTEDGFALCEEIRALFPGVQIVMCSVEADETMHAKALQAGAHMLLPKPVMAMDLSQCLDALALEKARRSLDPAQTLDSEHKIARLLDSLF